MTTDVVRIGEDDDRQEAARHGRNRLVATITVDDVIDVIDDRTTKDIQKLGGLEGLLDKLGTRLETFGDSTEMLSV